MGNAPPIAAGTLGETEIFAPGFVGARERLALYYSAADLMLFPSMGDNLPTMIQESMHAQTPVLAFATGGIPEMIDNGVDGWLVPRGDGDAFMTTLRRLFMAPELLREAGVRAREKITRAFGMRDCRARYQEFYRDVCS